MVKKVALLTGLFLMFSFLVLAIPHSVVQEAKAQEPTIWDTIKETIGGFDKAGPQSLTAPESGAPSAAPMTIETVRTTTAWHLAERFYNTVVYYAFFAPIEVIRNVISGIGRLFMGI